LEGVSLSMGMFGMSFDDGMTCLSSVQYYHISNNYGTCAAGHVWGVLKYCIGLDQIECIFLCLSWKSTW
jgi:hypothetical protein